MYLLLSCVRHPTCMCIATYMTVYTCMQVSTVASQCTYICHIKRFSILANSWMVSKHVYFHYVMTIASTCVCHDIMIHTYTRVMN